MVLNITFNNISVLLPNTGLDSKDRVPGNSYHVYRGGSRGGAHPARAPPKIGKNKIFWRKIVIFHTKYSKIFRASLRSAQIF
jgi:hypothetical protein